MDEYRESIWGIRPRDRRWFQLITLLGGAAGSVILTLLEPDSLSSGTPSNEVARNIALGIGASFVASGFIAWGLLQGKELVMSLGDWFREANARREQRRRVREYLKGYEKGYEDAREGKPPRPARDSGKGGQDTTDSNGSKR